MPVVVLFPPQFVVQSAAIEELVVPTVFNHGAGVDDEDAIGTLDGRQAVRHDEDRPLAREPF